MLMQNNSFRLLRAYWRNLSVAQALLLGYLVFYINRSSDPSLKLMLLAAGIVGVAAGVIIFFCLMTVERLEAMRRRLGKPIIARVYVVVGLGLMVIFGAGLRPEWFYAVSASMFSITLALFYWTIFSGVRAFRLGWVAVCASVAAVVLVILVRIYGLNVYPPVHPIDEPWTLGWAISYARTGELHDLMMVEREFEIYRFYQVMGEWLKIFGEGMWQARLFSFVLVLFVIVLSAFVTRNHYGKKAALFAAVYLLGSAVMMSASRIRHDVGLAVAVALSLVLHSEGEKRESKLLHFLSGCAIGLGMLAHFHAAFLGFAMLLSLYGPDYVANLRKRRLPKSGPWLYGFGGLIGVLIVLAIQPLPQNTGLIIAESPIASGGFMRATLQHFVNISHLSQVEFLLISVGFVAAIRRGQPVDVVVVMLGITTLLALGSASSGEGFEYYLVPLTPIFGLLVGSLFGLNNPSLHSRSSGKVTPVALIGAFLLAVIFGSSLFLSVDHILKGKSTVEAPPPQAAWVLDNVPTGSTVVGEHYYYLWLTEYHYVSPLAPSFIPEWLRSEYPTVVDFWRSQDVDVFVVDPELSTYPLFEPLIEADYFVNAGYKLDSTLGITQIYSR